MDVVDHQAHIERCELTDRIEDPFERFAAVADPIDGGHDRRPEVLGVAVGRLAREPDVDTPRVGVIGANRLGEQR